MSNGHRTAVNGVDGRGPHRFSVIPDERYVPLRCITPIVRHLSRPRVDSRGASVTAGLFIDPLDGARPQVAPRRRHDFLRAAPARALVVGVAVLPGEPGNDNDSIYDPRLLMEMRDVGDGREGTFDFILNIVGPPTTQPKG